MIEEYFSCTPEQFAAIVEKVAGRRDKVVIANDSGILHATVIHVTPVLHVAKDPEQDAISFEMRAVSLHAFPSPPRIRVLVALDSDQLSPLWQALAAKIRREFPDSSPPGTDSKGRAIPYGLPHMDRTRIERINRIWDAIDRGANLTEACQLEGMGPDTYRQWRHRYGQLYAPFVIWFRRP